MSEANLSGASLVNTNLNGGVLTFSDLGGANLHQATISGSWINLASLVGADLSEANLSASTFLGADLTGTNLQNAKLNGANLVGANLSGSDLRGADLTGAILDLPFPSGSSSSFSYNSLNGASLIAALNATVMSKVISDHRILDLTEVRLKPLLKDAILQGVLYDQQTKWPVNFTIPSSAILKEQ